MLLVAPTGAGKCVPLETLVWSGGQRRFGELWGKSRILGPLGPAAILGWCDDGRREGIELTLEIGFRIDGTSVHQVWVRTNDGIEGWR